MSVLENIKEKIEDSNSIVILTHEHPDGDAIGSSLALMHGLRKLGKSVDVIIPGVNKMYSILPGFEDIKEYSKHFLFWVGFISMVTINVITWPLTVVIEAYCIGAEK